MQKIKMAPIMQILTVSLLILTSRGHLSAQTFVNPIAGNIYGQPIVSCTGGNGTYEYAATDAAIYARQDNANAYYNKVWTAPGALHIVSFGDQIKNGGRYRAVLMRDGENNYYTAYNKIKAPAPDSAISGPVLAQIPALSPVSAVTVKMVAGSGWYVFSILAGGPPGNVNVSRDNGQTWQPDTLGIGYDNVYDIALDTAQNLWMAASSGIYRQVAPDSAWTILNLNLFGATSIFVDQSDRILTGGYPAAVYMSVDGGATFNINNIGIVNQVKFLTGDVYGNLYAASSGGPVYRNNRGTSAWTDITATLNTATGGDLQISAFSGDSVITAGTVNFGMFTSADHGNTWTATNNGIQAEDIYSIITQPNGRVLCTTALGIFYRDPADTLWHPTNPITSFYPGTQLSNDIAGNIFVAVAPTFGSPYPLGKSTDNGVNFTVDSDGFSAIGGSGFYIDETGARHFYNYYATGTDPLTVWTSPLGSSTWSLDTAGLPVFPIFGTGVKDMRGDGQGYLYASVDMPSGDILYRRPVSGTQWTADTAGLGASGVISPMASNPSFGIVVARGLQLYYRSASSWVMLPTLADPRDTGAFASGGINALSVDAHGVIYASASNYITPDSSAVFFTRDTGATWSLAGLVGVDIYALVSTGDTTYALTFGNWGYVAMSQGPTGISAVPAPDQYGIKVYPNPSASGIWTIEAGDEWTGSAVEISDMTGRIVYRGIMDRSTAQVGSGDLDTGIYVLRIYNGDNNMTGRLVK